MKIVLVLLSFLLLLSCKTENPYTSKKVNIELKKTVSIKSANHKISEITNFKIWKDYIFIVDNCEKKISKFDKNGKFIVSFGNKGNGPGEFLGIFHITISDNSIVAINDYEKRKFIKYNVDGKFIEEVKMNKLPLNGSICELSSFESEYIARLVTYNTANSKVTKNESIVKLNSNFEITKTICNLNKSTSKPNIMDFKETEFYFAVNKHKNTVALNTKNRLEFDLLIKNINNENTQKINADIKPTRLSENDKNIMKEEFDWHKKNFPQMNYQLNPLPNFKQTISQIKFDNNGYLWVAVSKNLENNKRIYVFDKSNKFLGFFEIEATFFEVSEKNIYCYVSENEENEKITVYRYNLKQ